MKGFSLEKKRREGINRTPIQFDLLIPVFAAKTPILVEVKRISKPKIPVKRKTTQIK